MTPTADSAAFAALIDLEILALNQIKTWHNVLIALGATGYVTPHTRGPQLAGELIENLNGLTGEDPDFDLPPEVARKLQELKLAFGL